ncbi:hypothetical protein RUM43_003909 [Polyplax serrata]|uniref:Uncharacterized protein n=1 Tax=Polyplax serrata TaxID=468196 RepID=A0AAN8S912_POLSC
MFLREDDYLNLQKEVKEKNLEIRNAQNERAIQKQRDRFQEIRNIGIRKKALVKRQREEKRMEQAITDAWLRVIKTPLPVSYAIDVLLETVIQGWATVRILLILETVIDQVKENSEIALSDIKAKRKDLGIPTLGSFKAAEPYGIVYREDPKEKKTNKKNKRSSSEGPTLGTTEPDSTVEQLEREIGGFTSTEAETPITQENKLPVTVVPNYVHYGAVDTFEYPMEYETEESLKSIVGRPKTPMPTQEVLCEVGFLEDKLLDVLPTLNDGAIELKEKRKLRKLFKSVAVKLFERAFGISKVALEPVTRSRAIHQLTCLGDTKKLTLANVLCNLLMNKNEKAVFETEEFEWLTKVMAREALKEVLNPPEFRKEEDDRVARTKIMFYKPKQKRPKEV